MPPNNLFERFKYFAITLLVLLLIGLGYTTYSLNKKVKLHEQAIREIAGVITKSGLVVPDKNGNAVVNQILLEAWRNAQSSPN